MVSLSGRPSASQAVTNVSARTPGGRLETMTGVDGRAWPRVVCQIARASDTSGASRGSSVEMMLTASTGPEAAGSGAAISRPVNGPPGPLMVMEEVASPCK